ncbi:MAG: hypothetical protein K0M69_05690 [Youngiibacter sp.]|nr:hypothetical protein [Youngiibacter sp.]
MSVKWNGTKLVKLIADNEIKVAELYRTMAKEVNKGIGVQFFENLAKDEERHNMIYVALLGKVPDVGDVELDEDDARYLDLLIDNNFLSDSEAVVAKARKLFDKSQVFDIAERVETDSVMFVTELARVYPDLAKGDLETILKEEKKHLRTILEKKTDRSIFRIGM